MLLFDKFFRGAVSAYAQHVVAHRAFQQHGQVTTGGHGQRYLRYGHTQDIAFPVAATQPVKLQQFAFIHAFELDDQAQVFIVLDAVVPVKPPDIDNAQAADFQEVAQQFGATAAHDVRRDARELRRVVGHQSAVAPGDEFQRQLALAYAAGAGDEHAYGHDFHEYAVQHRRVGE